MWIPDLSAAYGGADKRSFVKLLKAHFVGVDGVVYKDMDGMKIDGAWKAKREVFRGVRFLQDA